jgi:hypothetical protein
MKHTWDLVTVSLFVQLLWGNTLSQKCKQKYAIAYNALKQHNSQDTLYSLEKDVANARVLLILMCCY